MNSNIFYFNTLNSIGGIESFFYQLGIKYGKKFDITVNNIIKINSYINMKILKYIY